MSGVWCPWVVSVVWWSLVESPCICLGSGGSAGQQEGDGGLAGGFWCLVSGVWCMVSGVYCLVSAGQQEGDGGGVGNIAEKSSRNTSSELQIVKK